MRENFEPDVYRDNLAEQLKEAPREDRQEILEKAKKEPEYQVARNKKIEGRQNEEEIDDGLGVFVKKKTLYHGTSAKGIKKFEKAEETTVGDGIYLTSQAKNAIEYAYMRAKNPRGSKRLEADGNPIIYETFVENLKLLDLRKDENLEKVMKGFGLVLWQRAKEIGAEIKNSTASNNGLNAYRETLFDVFKFISSGEVKKISDIQKVTLHLEDGLFTNYVKSLGYDGLATVEGGEGDYMFKNHDSYVIFDPEKVKIIKEQKIKEKKI
ncbi:MAG: hypothetical protein AAB361_00730 [Patescibacteria group bacterium]